MREIFISYAREDRDIAHNLSVLLQAKGFNVWWDWNLIGGTKIRETIRHKLTTVDKAIVLWSRHSVTSGFVIDEACFAQDHNKLIPVLIDDSTPPFGFGNLHTIKVQHISRNLDAIIAALDDKPLPEVPPPFHLPFKRNLAIWTSAAIALVVLAAGTYFMISRTELSVGDKAAAAEQDYEFIQVVYSNVKNERLSCKGVEKLIAKLRRFQGSTSLVPKHAIYTVQKLIAKKNPTIGDLTVDRMTRIRDVRRECFK